MANIGSKVLSASDEGRGAAKNGFTLIEVLVALVVSSFLIVILLDGSLTAKLAKTRGEAKIQALSIAQEKMDGLRDQSGLAPALTGNKDGLRWSLTEREVASDPRGLYILVEAEMTVATKDAPKLLIRKKRYLKRLIDQ